MITVNNKFFNQQWGLKLINVEKAWTLLNGGNSALTGSKTEKAFGSPNINVVIIDNGVETINNLSTHKSFSGQTTSGSLKFLKNVVLENNTTLFDFKDYLVGSHGMGVSGIATAKAQINNLPIYNGEGIIGVAPNSSFYSFTTERDVQFKLLYMFGLAGLEFTSPKQEVLNDAYNITTDRINISPLMKQRGTLNAGANLNFFLNNTYADIFNLSLQILSSPNLITENYSKIIFNEISFFGREGRGCLSIIGAGNNGQDIEPLPNQFLNEFASSNKPIIVGAISVDNGYNWLTNNPPANAKKSNYSNFGARIDICAPGGGENPALPHAMGLQNKNLIFSTTVNGAGNICSNSPLKLTLKTKVNKTEFNPINHDYYASVELEFNNTNGVYVGQTIIIGEFSTLYNYEIYYVDAVIAGNKISIKEMKKTTYSNLIDSSSTGNRSIFEFTPMFTKIVAVSSNRTFKVENVKGAFASTTDKIYIGSLGDGSNGSTGYISNINPVTNEITLVSGLTAKVNDYVVFPRKMSEIFSGNTNGSKKIVVQSIEGFFPGGYIDIDESGEYSTITSIDVNARTINLENPLLYSTQTPGIKYVKNFAMGDITDGFNGTSAATPFVSGVAALVLSANPDLSSAEVKHILKETASSNKTVSNQSTPQVIPSYSLNGDGYMHNTHYGTGLLDAEKAVDLALKWHTDTTIQKPKLVIADKRNSSGVLVDGISPTTPVVSPDIWLKPSTNPGSDPLNKIDTSVDQKIYVKISNAGDRQSFKECDLRVLIAFTDEVNPAFKFPDCWYNQTDVMLLSVKEIPIIPAGGETTIEIEWGKIVENWNQWNPENNKKRKKAYLLAHIAPFDGLFEIDNSVPLQPVNLSLSNIRKNKQLTCKPIIVGHQGIIDGTAFLPNSKIDLTVGNVGVTRNNEFVMDNVLTADLIKFKVKATKKKQDTTITEVLYKKTDGVWGIEGTPHSWITFQPVQETPGDDTGYTNIRFPFTLTLNNDDVEIKLEIVNI